MDVSTPPDPSEECWLADIEGVGKFTQRQLMAMQYLGDMMRDCTNGLKGYSWLMSKVDELINDEVSASVAKQMIGTWPAKRLSGFGEGFQMNWSHLYCAGDACWYNDNYIQAFAKTLEVKYDNNCMVYLPQLKTPAPHMGKRIGPRALGLLTGTNKDWVFMPLNVNGNHWMGLVVNRPRQTIYCYDSLDKRAYHNLLEELAQELNQGVMKQSYEIVAVHTPVQTDSSNCGLFVCLYFWRRVYKEAGNDYSETGLLRRRWDVLRSVIFSDSCKKEDEDDKGSP
ncbi:hypothetical protein PInf_025921 [Phytophthora infestans]|nr:hypothetical protein PInf_025921 [Phytophthora infestans]